MLCLSYPALFNSYLFQKLQYLLASEMKRGDYDRLVSRRIFVFKVIGLIMSVGGGLSVGSEGPLVHTAGRVYF